MRRARALLAALAVAIAAPAAAQINAGAIQYTPPATPAFTGGAITSAILGPAADNCTAPPFSFTGQTTSGLCSPAAGTVALRVGGVNQLSQTATASTFTVPILLALDAGYYALGASSDVRLYRDAANTLALRNGVNAQAVNVYNTYTDASNYERGVVRFSGNLLQVGMDAAGAGTNRRVDFLVPFGATFNGTVYPSANDAVAFGTNGAQWTNAFVSRSIQGSKSKALTDAAGAVSIQRVAVPTNGFAGMLSSFTAESTDGTDRLTTTGLVSWGGADTAGTVTCGAPVVVGLSTAYRRANTLVCAFTAATSTTNCDLQVTCTDDLAGDQTMNINHFILSMPKPNTYTPQ